MRAAIVLSLTCFLGAAAASPAQACGRWTTADRNVGTAGAVVAAVCTKQGRGRREIFLHCRSVAGSPGFALRLSRSVALSGHRARTVPRRVVRTISNGRRRIRLALRLDRNDRRYVAGVSRRHRAIAILRSGRRLWVSGSSKYGTHFTLRGARQAILKAAKPCR